MKMEQFTANELRSIINLATNAYHEELRRVHCNRENLSEYGKRMLSIINKAWALLREARKHEKE